MKPADLRDRHDTTIDRRGDRARDRGERGAWSQGKASRNCCAVHAAVGTTKKSAAITCPM